MKYLGRDFKTDGVSQMSCSRDTRGTARVPTLLEGYTVLLKQVELPPLKWVHFTNSIPKTMLSYVRRKLLLQGALCAVQPAACAHCQWICNKTIPLENLGIFDSGRSAQIKGAELSKILYIVEPRRTIVQAVFSFIIKTSCN